MEVVNTGISGLLLLKPKVFVDGRGYFYESYSKNKYKDAGINLDFVQDNVSRSIKNTIRGLHYQIGDHQQGKLCTVLLGKVLDVAVDIRFGSPTFGQYFSTELSDENKHQLFLPPGFAHGFSVLSDYAVFYYKCTALYNKESERCILYSDKILSIDWKVENPIVSEKDLIGVNFNQIEEDFKS
ncbi:MAG: dTDP-4-dehydrorhamnose 3,5-epimerase [Ignavibacteriae bacterium HGW-Ignavibacteriae-2]|jgi:dTDP-4-dehydrorhamnose 3,5-epimerase|nr:MAG: dTDP-4-dehydrorhamnose 3,5-epimerase [Ignavibacteriae bacterium HGW-Ignavibacteriae-2]